MSDQELLWKRNGDDFNVRSSQLYAIGLLESYLVSDTGNEYITSLARAVPAMHVNLGLLSVSAILIKIVSERTYVKPEEIVEELRECFLERRGTEDLYETGLFSLTMLIMFMEDEEQDFDVLNVVAPVELMTGFVLINSILLRMSVKHWTPTTTAELILKSIRQFVLSSPEIEFE